MKKASLAFICCLLFAFTGLAQSFNWQWAKGSTGPGQQEGYAVAADAKGNVYITGSFRGDSIVFGGITLFRTGLQDLFIAKYSPAGQVLWAKTDSLGGSNVSYGTGLATDSAGDVYLTGAFTGVSLGIDSTTIYNLTPADKWDVLLVKFDSSGNVLWGATASTSNQAQSTGVATDKNGNVFMTGWVEGNTITFGGITLPYVGGSGIFITKYDSAGDVLWAKNPTGGFMEYQYGIATDGAGSVYVTGFFQSASVSFDTLILYNTEPPANYNTDGFIAKYDSSGNRQWAELIAGNMNYYGVGIATDRSNNAYVTGGFLSDTLSFGTHSLYDSSIAGSGQSYFYLVKYDTAGNVLWAKRSGGSTGENELGYSIAADTNNNLYVAGAMFDSIILDSLTIKRPPVYSDPMFVAVFDSTGRAFSGAALGSGGDDQNAICVNAAGAMYIGGDYEVNPFTAGADTLLQSDTLPMDEGENIFVARFGIVPCPTTGPGGSSLVYQLSTAILCPGDSAVLDFTGDSAVRVLPAALVTWLDSLHAVLKPDTSTAFTIAGYSPCGVYNTKILNLYVAHAPVTITADKTVMCPGDSAQICAPGGFTAYRWSNSDTTSCISVTAQGNYMVTVTANGHCTVNSDTAAIVVYTLPQVTVSVNGDTLSGNGAISYQWFYNGQSITTADSQVYIANSQGIYLLQIVDSDGCVALSPPVGWEGVNELTNYSVAVFPNPTVGSWQLAVPIAIGSNELIGSLAEVFDATGRLVCKFQIANSNMQIPISKEEAGVYQLCITGPGYRVVRKLVKM